MEKMNEPTLKSPEKTTSPTFGSRGDVLEPTVRITDRRVAQLLIVLHEIDVGAKALNTLSEGQLSDMVATAIMACGFTDLEEARIALRSILDVIGPEPLGDEKNDWLYTTS